MARSSTNVSLIHRIRENRHDEAAWREFVERYGSRIYHWCLNRKLNATDAEDVTQNVLLRLAKHLEKFEYDANKSFRGWLRRITENAIKDFVTSQALRLNQAKGGSGVMALLSEAPARAELTAELEQAFDLELFDLAKSRVKARVNENRWMSWQLTAEAGKSGKDVAAELAISVGTVYANKNQVQKLIREEVEKLEHPP